MKRRIFALLLVLTFLTLTLAGCRSKNIAAESRSGVVRVLTVDKYGDIYVGSAFGVGKAGEAPTYFVTNHHVVSDEDGSPMVAVYILKDSYSFTAMGLDTSRMIPCDIIYRDDNGAPDLAVIRAAEPVTGRTTLPLMENVDSHLEAGDMVYALGYPTSADMTSSGLLGAVEDVTITNGVVSRLAEYAPMENTRIIQHTASINGGNSGGPLINEYGAVVGINTEKFNSSGLISTDVNHYASVRIEYAMRVLDDLGIDYEIYTPGLAWWIIALIVAAVIAIVAVVLVVVLRKKGPEKPPVDKREPGFGPPDVVPVIVPAQEYRIQGVSGVFAGRRFAVNEGVPVRFGTDPSANDMVFPTGTAGVSRRHCVLTLKNGQIWLQDVGSTYGTVAGTQRLVKDQPVALHKGDRFSLGSDQQCFTITGKGGV